jgi:para-nitrobenzyl esterase
MRTFWKAAAFAVLALSGYAGAAQAVPMTSTVRIGSGVIVGYAENGLAQYHGIPYAAPPVGPLRWKPPQPVAPWTGEREATWPGPVCAQPIKTVGLPNEGGVETKGSEDCLTLQVFAPTGAKHAPVMVWLHGGGNTRGAGSLGAYNGSAFARDGVVLVSVNYRLGPLGFFAHPALTKEAGPHEPLSNYGLMDQIAALAWVQKNIAAFGGDASNVTVFGESAGGQDTLALLAIPSAKGLFAKAIVESGGGWSEPTSLAKAETEGEATARKAGAPDSATAAQLRALPLQALVDATGREGPVVDGRLMLETPTQAFARGDADDVPLIIGSNSFEASLIAIFGVQPGLYLATQPASLKAAYAEDKLDDKGLAYALFTDGVMGAPARWIARKASSGAPSWLYYFSYVTENRRNHVPGAGHATEIPFVFDTWGRLGKLGEGYTPSADTQALTNMMHACWVAFAKTGRPGHCAPGGWPAYDPIKDQLMEFGEKSGLRTNLRKPELDAQEAAKAKLLAGN